MGYFSHVGVAIKATDQKAFEAAIFAANPEPGTRSILADYTGKVTPLKSRNEGVICYLMPDIRFYKEYPEVVAIRDFVSAHGGEILRCGEEPTDIEHQIFGDFPETLYSIREVKVF